MIHRDVKRGASVHIPKFGVGAVIQKELRDVIVTAVEGGHQRSDTFKAVRNVDVCTCTYKRLHTVIAAVASRVLERSQATIAVILSAWLRCHLGWPIRGLGASLHIGAF
jgi:hypothetical protein